MKNIAKKCVRELIYNKYGGRCAYCGCELTIGNFQIDHIKPIYRNLDRIEPEKRGTNDIENFNPCCASCNSSKSTLSVDQWRREIELKTMRINRDSAQYRILKRFHLIKETPKEVIFYFERAL